MRKRMNAFFGKIKIILFLFAFEFEKSGKLMTVNRNIPFHQRDFEVRFLILWKN